MSNKPGGNSFSSRHSGNAIVNWQLWSQQVFILGQNKWVYGLHFRCKVQNGCSFCTRKSGFSHSMPAVGPSTLCC